MSELIRLLIIVIVIGFFAWLINAAPIPLAPVKWALWAILLVLALVALLPFLGIRTLG